MMEERYFGRNSNKFDSRTFIHVQAESIRMVKEWHKYQDSYEILMDVYGFLDSEINTSIKDFGPKKFVLRDGTDSIYVTFYEIDIPMVNVNRRNWLKVTCVWRYWGLQAVKIQFPEDGYFMENFDDKADLNQLETTAAVNTLRLSADTVSLQVDRSTNHILEVSERRGKKAKKRSWVREVHCQLCESSVLEQEKEMQAHVILKHMDEKAVCCPYCDYTSCWNYAKVEHHVLAKHSESRLKILDKRSELMGKVKKLTARCFPMGKMEHRQQNRAAAQAEATEIQYEAAPGEKITSINSACDGDQGPGSLLLGMVVPDDNIFLQANAEQLEQVLEVMYHWNRGCGEWSMKVHSQVLLQLDQAKKKLNPTSPAVKRLSEILRLLTKFRNFGVVQMLQNHYCDAQPLLPRDYLLCVQNVAAITKLVVTTNRSPFLDSQAIVVFLTNLDPLCAEALEFKEAGIAVMDLRKFIQTLTNLLL